MVSAPGALGGSSTAPEAEASAQASAGAGAGAQSGAQVVAWSRSCLRLLLGLALFLLAAVPQRAFAGGPRFVTGPPFFTGTAGVPIVWRQQSLLYFTDPGALSGSVDHATADALVAAAAGVWNVPVSNITLGQGGALLEHVSGANAYLGAGGMAWPADVSSGNAAAVPVAVVYDSDGSVTDTLLGAGASAPASCRQNAVTESVDLFDPAGYILHAVIVINGRCTDPSAAAAQLQIQYQLERVFGRVLGLAWSQSNDNVFTGTPVPTYDQAMHWPIMHPLDILCGSYTYACLPSPFTLRPDDVAALVGLYPVTAPAANGKTPSLTAAAWANGAISFPTGEGMAGLNVLAVRNLPGTSTPEGFVTASAVTGSGFRRNGVSPLLTPGSSAAASFGSVDIADAGVFRLPYVPIPAGQSAETVVLQTEAVNPLYLGSYALGPYAAGVVSPSGSGIGLPSLGMTAGVGTGINFTVADAAASCGNGLDGTTAEPAEADPSGWWQGVLCGWGHSSWTHLPVQPGRTLTVELTALDSNGLATTAKAMPVLGLYPVGGTGGTPLALAAAAFNGTGVGVTSLAGSTGTLTGLELGIADQRGDGRPDFPFSARVLYADAVSPVSLPAGGGVVTVSGMGFRPGNQVYVNGVAGTVTASTATTLTATAPSMLAAGAAAGTAVNVEVVDLGTGGRSLISGAVTYVSGGTLPRMMQLVSAPAAAGFVGVPATVPFAVRVLEGDGVTPVAGVPVVFSVPAGVAGLLACGGASSCSIVTDGTGTASTAVTPGAAGTVSLAAADGSLAELASFEVLAADAEMRVIEAPTGTQPVGIAAQPPLLVRVWAPDDYSAAAGRTITFRVTSGAAELGTCFSSTCSTVTDANGVTEINVTPTAPGPVTVTASDGLLLQTISFVAAAAPDTMTVTSTPANGTATGTFAGVFAVHLALPDGSNDSWETVHFSAPAGVVFTVCSATPCAVQSDATGSAGTGVQAATAGSFPLTATFTGPGGTATQQVVWTAVSATANRFRIVSFPASGSPVGAWTATPFTVQALGADGNPAAGVSVTLGGTADSVATNCGRGTCLVTTDGNGMATVQVIPLRAGSIPLSAVYTPFTVSGAFTAVAASELMTVVAQPGAGTYAGDPETFTVQVLKPDGTTPASGETVTFAVAAGAFQFTGAGGSVVTDANGRATVSGVALAGGAVTVTATDGAVSVSMSFTVGVRADVMKVVSAPGVGGAVTVGIPATPFAVQVFLPDGVTPAAGRAITFAVSVGTEELGCGTNPCAATTDAQGRAQMAVVPELAGAGTLEAIDAGGADGGTTYQTVSFSAAGAPNLIKVLSVPGSTNYVGQFEASPFTVEVVRADGVTAVPGEHVALSTVGGSVQMVSCNGGPGCTVVTDSNGQASTALLPLTAGTLTLQAVDGPLLASAQFQVLSFPDRLSVVSGPANGSYAGGAAAVPFSVQVLRSDGTPAAGQAVTVSVTAGNATLGSCGASTCVIVADAHGLLLTTVLPAAAGSVTLAAVDTSSGAGPVEVDWSFTTAVRADTLTVLSSPANGAVAGAPAAPAFAVQVLGGFAGSAPQPGRLFTFSVVSGPATLPCGAASCPTVADSTGRASVGVTGTAAGTVVLRAVDSDPAAGGASVQVSFSVVLPHRLAVVSVPADPSYVGGAAAPAFAVQVLQGDGVTPVAGETVTLAVTGGSATLGCGACVLVSDAGGMVSAAVTPAAAGLVGLAAVDGTVTAAASFTAVARADALGLVSSPADGDVVGVSAAPAFAVRVTGGYGGTTPEPGRTVVFSVASGPATLLCGASTCPVLTDSNGVASVGVTGTAPGTVVLGALDREPGVGGAAASATFTVVAPVPDVVRVTGVPADGSFVGGPATPVFAVQVLAADGVTPRANRAVTLAVVGGAATLSCGSCALLTDAQGNVSTAVTPTAAGTVLLQATDPDGGNGPGAPAVTASASFAPAVRPDALGVTSSPADGDVVGQAATPAFTVRVTGGYSGTAAQAGRTVIFSVVPGSSAAGAATLACGALSPAVSCAVQTDSNGLASVGAVGSVAGPVVLQAADADPVAGGATVQRSFVVVLPHRLVVVSAPADGSYTGVPASPLFAVRVLAGDGVTPVSGETVQFTVAAGLASLGCGTGQCSATTDAAGAAAVSVTAEAAGTISVQAADGTVTAQASFAAVEQRDGMAVSLAPSAQVYVGSATPFAVRVTAGEGATPAAGVAVVFTASGAGQVQLLCGAAAPAAAGQPCTVTTDATGAAQVSLVGASPGAVLLTALAAGAPGSPSASAATVVVANQYAVSAAVPAVYLAVGATARELLTVTALENGAPAAGVTVNWSGTGGVPASPTSTADAGGTASMEWTLGPVAAGASAAASGCAWTGVCGTVAVVAVPDGALLVTVTAGAAQSPASTSGVSALTAVVTDGAGHPVAGAAVQVYETLYAGVACPPHGRCPSAPVLGREALALFSANDGTVTFAPLSGNGDETLIELTAGTNGLATADVRVGLP